MSTASRSTGASDVPDLPDTTGSRRSPLAPGKLVVWLGAVGLSDIDRVGGKNASLGELICSLQGAGVRVPDGFATTVDAFRLLIDGPVGEELTGRLADLRSGRETLEHTAAALRELLESAPVPPELSEAIAAAYTELGQGSDESEPLVAVRSSATAEDLPDASFAGQQETFLGVRGVDDVVTAWRRCIASLYTDRAMAYREEHGFDHAEVELSVGVQRLVRSDLASAGVAFTVDPETGFDRVVLISSSWGLGEAVVGGLVQPDEFLVFTPFLADDRLSPIMTRIIGEKQVQVVRADGATVTVPTPPEDRRRLSLGDGDVLQLARWATAIADHYGCPMDVEWAKDGITGDLYIVQARPETVQSRRDAHSIRTFRLTGEGRELARGIAVGDRIGAGPVRVLRHPDQGHLLVDGEVLVTTMTDPDWVPVMRRAAAIVTDHGGRTSHAAIVSRELGLPAVLGTGTGTSDLAAAGTVTVSCAEGEIGVVYDGELPWEVEEVDLTDVPRTRTRVKLNLADPSAAFRHWRLGADGVGLARMEFIISQHVGIHPLALASPERLHEPADIDALEQLRAAEGDPAQFMVDRIAGGVARIAAVAWPNRCIVRLSDFKSNEYASMPGGSTFEPDEENPMLGWRGASRYLDPEWAPAFALECQAIDRVRREVGFTNIAVMIPFCRTLKEADGVLVALATHGLVRGELGLEVWVMAELPANVMLADQFATRFDGFSIGSNDLTQLVLGLDRDNSRLADSFDETDPAVVAMIELLVRTAHDAGRQVGLCGQAPSNSPSFAALLARIGIDSVSVTPDSYLAVRRVLADAERTSPPSSAREL